MVPLALAVPRGADDGAGFACIEGPIKTVSGQDCDRCQQRDVRASCKAIGQPVAAVLADPRSIDNRVPIYQLHPALSHRWGLYHEQLTFRNAGLDFRSTDVYGNVVHDLIV